MREADSSWLPAHAERRSGFVGVGWQRVGQTDGLVGFGWELLGAEARRSQHDVEDSPQDAEADGLPQSAQSDQQA